MEDKPKRNIMEKHIREVYNGFMECAIWADLEENEGVTISMLDTQDAEKVRHIIEFWWEENEEIILESLLSNSSLGHNLWLSATGHGAGFFDIGSMPLWNDLQQSARRINIEFSHNLWVDENQVLFMFQ
jgi:hypothetical protein